MNINKHIFFLTQVNTDCGIHALTGVNTVSCFDELTSKIRKCDDCLYGENSKSPEITLFNKLCKLQIDGDRLN